MATIRAPRISPDFTPDHAARVRPELAVVPPCRVCGNVPVGGYSRDAETGETVACLRCPSPR